MIRLIFTHSLFPRQTTNRWVDCNNCRSIT